MRGTVLTDGLAHALVRITPACAGNRLCSFILRYGLRDHPRVCGEQNNMGLCKNNWRGSPPRVRGTEVFFRRSKRRCGITPACAGNSGREHGAAAACEDHPRVCGEQSVKKEKPRVLLGSPPRVRGTAYSIMSGLGRFRITPACAGNR